MSHNDITIVYKKRTSDIHVQLAGKPGIWACGKNLHEAIGDLVMHHPERFGVVIEPANPTEEGIKREGERDGS